jgi:hypothetical protein
MPLYARVSTFQTPANKVEEGIRWIRDTAVPGVRNRLQQGMKHGYWCVDRKTAKTLIVTFWESADAERATSAGAAQLRSQAEAALGTKTTSVEVSEVIDQI